MSEDRELVYKRGNIELYNSITTYIETRMHGNGIGIRNVEIRVNGCENINIYYLIEISLLCKYISHERAV